MWNLTIALISSRIPSGPLYFEHNFQFLEREKKEVEKDTKYSIIEYSDTIVANITSKKLIDVEYDGFKTNGNMDTVGE